MSGQIDVCRTCVRRVRQGNEGGLEHHVEVKGIRGFICSFPMTANEKQAAEVLPISESYGEIWMLDQVNR